MTRWRLAPALFSLVILGAHMLRGGETGIAIGYLFLAGALFSGRAWTRWASVLFLGHGVVTWLMVLFSLVSVRSALGEHGFDWPPFWAAWPQ